MDWEQIKNDVLAWLPKFGISVLKIVLALAFSIIALRILVSVLRKVLHKTKIDMVVVGFVLSVARTLGIILIVIFVLSVAGIDVTALTASLGAFGVVITLILKDSMSSLASGISIITNKPFRSGDFVDIGGISGEITEIHMLSTELITPDNKTIVVPNSTVASSPIVNYSTQEYRRLDIKMSASYDCDVELVKNTIVDTIKSDNRVIKDKEIFAAIDSFGDSAIEFFGRFWVKNADFWVVNREMTEKILIAFRKNNIDVPYNQLDVNIKSVDTPSVKGLSKVGSALDQHYDKLAEKEQAYHDKLNKD